jgi:hypothetical protein
MKLYRLAGILAAFWGAIGFAQPFAGAAPTLSIEAVATGNGYYSLWGTCSATGGILHLTFSGQGTGTGYTFVPCVGGSWIYNEAYYTSGPSYRWTAHQGSATATLVLGPGTPSTEIPGCSQPYTWKDEMTTVFGTESCHKVAYCASGRVYVYADSISTGCR